MIIMTRILFVFKKSCKEEKKKRKEQIITKIPKYTDEELISLFSDEKPTQANKKNRRRIHL